MTYLYDFGELLFCILPIFLVIGAIGLGLLANSWPPRRWAKEEKNDEQDPTV